MVACDDGYVKPVPPLFSSSFVKGFAVTTKIVQTVVSDEVYERIQKILGVTGMTNIPDSFFGIAIDREIQRRLTGATGAPSVVIDDRPETGGAKVVVYLNSIETGRLRKAMGERDDMVEFIWEVIVDAIAPKEDKPEPLKPGVVVLMESNQPEGERGIQFRVTLDRGTFGRMRKLTNTPAIFTWEAIQSHIMAMEVIESKKRAELIANLIESREAWVHANKMAQAAGIDIAREMGIAHDAGRQV